MTFDFDDLSQAIKGRLLKMWNQRSLENCADISEIAKHITEISKRFLIRKT